MSAFCAYLFPDGHKCYSMRHEHVHTPLPCANGKPERHHEFVPPQPHEHVIDRCICGYRASPDPARTHGRHCPCSACAREDWTNPELAHCGMHGPSCPRVYAPDPAQPPEDV